MYKYGTAERRRSTQRSWPFLKPQQKNSETGLWSTVKQTSRKQHLKNTQLLASNTNEPTIKIYFFIWLYVIYNRTAVLVDARQYFFYISKCRTPTIWATVYLTIRAPLQQPKIHASFKWCLRQLLGVQRMLYSV